MTNYIPENNYLDTNYKPIKGFTNDVCVRCEAYYSKLFKCGVTKTPFPPTCTKHVANKSASLKLSDFPSEQDYHQALIVMDPITWAQAEFGWSARFYQEDILSCTAKKKILRAGRRVGKCLAKDTQVVTPKGPIAIQDLKPGDLVYGSTGAPIKVKNVFYQGMKEVVDYKNNGKILTTATLDHRWLVKDERRTKTHIRAGKDFYKGIKIIRREVSAPLGKVEEPHAYLLGALLGDGCCRNGMLSISSATDEVPSKLSNILNTTFVGNNYNYTWNASAKLKKSIHHYDEWLHNKYAHEKTVDKEILITWTRNSMLEFLAGILDTDGSVQFHNNEIQISIGMQAKSVIEAVQYAFLALWQIPLNIHIDSRPKYKNGPVFYVSLKHIYHCKRVLRELTPHLQVDKKKFKSEYEVLKPNNFDPTSIGVTLSNPRYEECYDIEVDSEDHLFLLASGLLTHNSQAMIIEMLYQAVTVKDSNVLVIAPYERQVTLLFDEAYKMIKSSVSISNSLSRYTKTPSRMDFVNGSKVLGFSAGANSASGSDKIRGFDAHLIIIDEFDTLENEDIDAILAILASRKECRLVTASTPRGWRKRFYTYITDKDLGFKEFWFISAESPEWTEEVEKFFRRGDPAAFTHEYLADFAELEEGVFKARFLNSSVQEYSLDDTEPLVSADYILGVDWNKSAGTHMVILEWFGSKLKLVRKIVVPESEYTQTDAVELIISLNRKWRFKYIFVDAGYGHTQVELLKKQGLYEPSSLLEQKVFGIHMNQHLDVIDPITGEPVKRNSKHFLIEQTRKLLEDGYLILPKSEDTTVSQSDQTMGLVQQMRNYRIEGMSIYGLPKYSQGQDHTLTAYYLGCGGFFWKEGELRQLPYSRTVIGLEVNDEKNKTMPASVIERIEDQRRGWKLVNTTNKKEVPRPLNSREIPEGRGFGRRGQRSLKHSMDSRKNSSISRSSSPFRRRSF